MWTLLGFDGKEYSLIGCLIQIRHVEPQNMETFQHYQHQLYLAEASWLSTFQQKLSGFQDFIVPISSIGDPSKGLTVYFPILLSLNYLKGIKFLGAFIICEWVNMVGKAVECCWLIFVVKVGKWLLHGERPYWWVAERDLNLTLLQTPLSCETGPGLPSGHSQATALISFCLADSLSTAFLHSQFWT